MVQPGPRPEHTTDHRSHRLSCRSLKRERAKNGRPFFWSHHSQIFIYLPHCIVGKIIWGTVQLVRTAYDHVKIGRLVVEMFHVGFSLRTWHSTGYGLCETTNMSEQTSADIGRTANNRNSDPTRIAHAPKRRTEVNRPSSGLGKAPSGLL